MKLDLKSGVPIYLQIVEAMKQAGLYGRYAAGDRLPSVRDLAMELRINPNTVAKAYRTLQEEGVIESRPGGGNFMATRTETALTARKEEVIRGELEKIADQARTLGVDRPRLEELFRQALNKKR